MNESLPLMANLVVKVEGHTKLQRILFVNPETDALAHIDIDGKSARQEVSKISLWTELRDEGGIEWADDPYTELPFQHAITPAMKQRRDTAWDAISPLLKNTDVLDRSKFFKLINERAIELGIHKNTIRNWLIEYWQKGQTPAALYGARNKAGGKGKTRTAQATPDATAGTAKRGRARTIVPGVGVNVSVAHRRIINLSVKRFYHKNRQTSLRHTYLKMLRHFFQEAVAADEKGRVKVINPEAIITYRQFVYWARRESNPVTDTIARKGNTFFEKTLRPLLGNVTDDAIGPGYRYQIDATIADVYLVSSINRQTIIGRPVVYVVIDVWSRLIIGIYVGLENASWPTAMMALHNATIDKVEWCKSFDIDIEPHEWPTAGLSSTILGDRGEMLSTHADHLVKVLGIDVENTPPYRADWKSIVERIFGTLQAKFAPEIPAYVHKDYMPRLDDDHRLDATLTLREFTKVMIHCVLDHNSSIISGYPMHSDMVNDGVAAIPTELWAWGLKNRMGTMLKHSKEKILFGLLPTDKATISAHGVRFHGRRYKSTEPHVTAWFTNARRNGSNKVTVSYYPHNLDTVLVHDETHAGRFAVLRLNSHASTVWNLCVEEVLSNNVAASTNNGARTFDVIASKSTRQKAIEDITEEAVASKKSLGPDDRSKKEILAHMRENKKLEKAVGRLEQNAPRQTTSIPAQTEIRPIGKAPPIPYTRPQLKDLMDDD